MNLDNLELIESTIRIYLNQRPLLLIIRGVPGSGKSTLAKEICLKLGNIYNYFEADNFFINTKGSYIFDKSSLQEAHDKCFKDSVKAINKCGFAINSNTNCSDKLLIKMIDKYRNEISDLKIIIIELKTSYNSIHNVPEKTINKMRNQLKQSAIKADFIIDS